MSSGTILPPAATVRTASSMFSAAASFVMTPSAPFLIASAHSADIP